MSTRVHQVTFERVEDAAALIGALSRQAAGPHPVCPMVTADLKPLPAAALREPALHHEVHRLHEKLADLLGAEAGTQFLAPFEHEVEKACRHLGIPNPRLVA